MKHTRITLGLLLGVVQIPGVASAEPIATDRPDIVESGSTVGRGTVQIESGVATTWDDLDDARPEGLAFPTLVRLGLGGDVELRLESEVLSWTWSPRAVEAADLSPGIKWSPWAAGEATGPAIALLLHYDVPLAGGAAGRRRGVPSLRMVVEGALGEAWGWGVMPGARWDIDDRGVRRWSGMLAAVVGRDLPHDLRVHLEAAVTGVDARGWHALADTGLAWGIREDLQLDAFVAVGLVGDEPPVSVGMGVSRRF